MLERGLARSGIDMVGQSQRFMEMMREVERAAQSRAAVLVCGESGTGKELVAHKLHQLSPARNKPFVVVDCASLSDELMHNDLFGHEKGAYTGATERKHGLFEVADGGSLCLDEVAEVSPRVQAKLLRVIDGGTFRRAGGTREIQVDVRVISSTNRRLQDLVKAGAFREDLYYRLSLLTISVPPVREREEDIPLLAKHFFARAVRRLAAPPTLDSSAMDALKAHGWPGNVRELLGVVEQLVVFRSGPVIGSQDVAVLLSTHEPQTASSYGSLPLADVERRHIEQVLRQCGGHRAEAARVLGISERTLYRKLEDL
jgi:DNA-binding NtrC family response regulator